MTKEKGVPKTRGIEGSQKGEHKLIRKKMREIQRKCLNEEQERRRVVKSKVLAPHVSIIETKHKWKQLPR